MAIVLLGLLVIAYKSFFIQDEIEIGIANENENASARVATVLASMDRINFNKNILNDPKFATFKDFSVPMISLPIGKKNPFAPAPNEQGSQNSKIKFSNQTVAR